MPNASLLRVRKATFSWFCVIRSTHERSKSRRPVPQAFTKACLLPPRRPHIPVRQRRWKRLPPLRRFTVWRCTRATRSRTLSSSPSRVTDPNECDGARPAQNHKAARVSSCGEKSDDELFDRTTWGRVVPVPSPSSLYIRGQGTTACVHISLRGCGSEPVFGPHRHPDHHPFAAISAASRLRTSA